MHELLRDLRFGLRNLLRRPGFTAVAVATLALGIGVTAAIFSVVNAVFLHALPYPEPGRLVIVEGVHREAGKVDDWPISYLDYRDWRRRNGVFAQLAAHSAPRSYNLTLDGRAERVQGEMATAETFPLLGVEALHGRLFAAAEDEPASAQRVVLLSHDFWRHRLGGDPAWVGRSLTLDEESFQVVGVLEPGFAGLTDEAQLFLPLALAGELRGSHFLEVRQLRWLSAVGRLAPGVSAAQAQAAMDGLTAAMEEEHPEENEGIGVRVTPVMEAWFGDLRVVLAVLLGGALAVLLVAWTNIGNLLLARAAARRPEIALRSALGAGRGRLVRQLLTESLVLSAAGCAAGLALAPVATRLLVRVSGVDLRSFVEPGVDAVVAGAMAALSLAGGFLFGLVPALLSSRRGLAEVLKAGGKSAVGERGRQSFQRGLVVAQVALALVLSVGAALLARGFEELRGTDLGFEAGGLLTARMDLQGPSFAGQPPKRQLIAQALERLPALPGVGELALAGPNIPTDGWSGFHFTVEGRADGVEEPVVLSYHCVSPDYFRILSIPLVAGRAFAAGDGPEAPMVMIVSEGMARRFWPGEEALGKRVAFGGGGPDGTWLTVVGVVADVVHDGLGVAPRPAPDIYLSIFQVPPAIPPVLNLLVRADGVPPASLVPALRRELGAIEPRLALYDPVRLSERLDRQVRNERALALVTGLFAALALGLAALGLYGVVSYLVTLRTREIGVRMALGSSRRRVLRQVVGGGLALALAGVVLGLVAALALARSLEHLLHGVSPADPLAFAAVPLLLLAVTGLAALLPARRATRIPPVVALREE